MGLQKGSETKNKDNQCKDKVYWKTRISLK